MNHLTKCKQNLRLSRDVGLVDVEWLEENV